MSSQFAEIMSGQAPDWAREASSAAGLYLPRNCTSPAVAFTMVAFRPSSIDYLDSLRLNEFKPSSFNNFTAQSHTFNVAGWTKNPALAAKPRALFVAKAQPYYPDRSGRIEMLEDVSLAFAGLASALDTRLLKFTCRMAAIAEDWPKEFNQYSGAHEDTGAKYTALIALINRGTTIFPAPPATPMALPRFALALWTEVQTHAAPGVAGERATMLAHLPVISLGKARPAKPNPFMKMCDWMSNKRPTF